MDYLGGIFCNDINNYAPGAKEKAIESASKHTQQLLDLINN